MRQRLTSTSKPDMTKGAAQTSSPDMLTQSLTKAMGQIEKLYGREASIEAMAKIMSGTADGVTEESLMSAVQYALSGLSKYDQSSSSMKQLTDGFNKDLTLAFDEQLTDKKINSGETLSLSYAIAKHFGSLSNPGAPQQKPGDSGEYTAIGFNENGKRGEISLTPPVENEDENLKEAANTGLIAAQDMTLAGLMITSGQDGAKAFSDLAVFLETELQDKETAAYVNKVLDDAAMSVINQNDAAAKITDVISKVYSNVANNGDQNKLASLENYLNGDFKDSLNLALANLPQKANPNIDGLSELGQVMFKGLNGLSNAEENDQFTINWGYQNSDDYDKGTVKRCLKENTREVKEVKEKIDEAEVQKQVDLLKHVSDVGQVKAGAGETTEANQKADRIWSEHVEQKQQNILKEVLGTKFGQLNDNTVDELKQYLKDNFTEEEAEKLLEHVKWNKDLFGGLNSIYNDIKTAAGGQAKADEFIKYINSAIKDDVQAIANTVGGLKFEGWQADGQPTAGLAASLRFSDQQDALNAITVTVDEANKQIASETRNQHSNLGCLLDLFA